ncbi:hypothetical protein ACQSNQ_004504 [Vibrio parahaemolyticus]
MNKQDFINMGGKEWSKDGMERVYINSDIYNELMGRNLSDKTNKFFFDCAANALMRSYKGGKPKIEIQYEINTQPTSLEDEVKVISTELTDLGMGCIAIDVEVQLMEENFSFQRGFYPASYEIDESLEDDGFDSFCSFVDECTEEVGSFDRDKFMVKLNEKIVIHHKMTEFESELKKIGITQTEFCERIGMTKQTVIGWKRAGKYPEWLKYALKGMPLIINEEKTVTINGENYIHVDDPLLVSFNGQLISIFEAVDGTYIISKADLDLKPATEDCGEYTKTKSFNSLDECHEFISKVANGRPYNDCAVHLDIDSLLN